MSSGANAGTGPAFNVADAMGRLMNNKNLYKKLLDKFEAGYGDYGKQLETAIAAGNFEDVVHLAHTMKGLAGNLGAEDLQAASLEVETLGKKGEASPEFAPAMERFAAELTRALEAVRSGTVID